MSDNSVIKEAKCGLHELVRLSENGDAFCLWGFETPYPMKIVLGAGFFKTINRHGLRRNDRILITAEANSLEPEHATLIITSSFIGGEITVAVLGSTHRIEALNLTPFEVLRIDPKSTADAVELAYRALAKMMHPDAEGGSAKRMTALNKAKEESLKLIHMRLGAA